jgi:hypothetical protein
MRKAKAAHFKQATAKAARGKRGIWPLAKWAKVRSHLPHTPLFIPNLVTPAGTSTTPIEKAEALKAQFLIPMPDADLSDIPNTSYLPEMPSPMSISKEEISSVIERSRPFEAAGSDDICFFVLKCLESPLISFL